MLLTLVSVQPQYRNVSGNIPYADARVHLGRPGLTAPDCVKRERTEETSVARAWLVSQWQERPNPHTPDPGEQISATSKSSLDARMLFSSPRLVKQKTHNSQILRGYPWGFGTRPERPVIPAWCPSRKPSLSCFSEGRSPQRQRVFPTVGAPDIPVAALLPEAGHVQFQLARFAVFQEGAV